MSLRIGLSEIYSSDDEIYKTTTDSNQTVWSGFSWVVLNDLLKLANVKHEFIDIQEEKKGFPHQNLSNPYQLCLFLLLRDKLDLCSLLYPLSSLRSGRIDYFAPFLDEVSYRGFVLKREKEKNVSVWSVFNAFDAPVWFWLVGVVVVLVLFCGLVGLYGGRSVLGEIGRGGMRVWGSLVMQGVEFGSLGASILDIDRLKKSLFQKTEIPSFSSPSGR